MKIEVSNGEILDKYTILDIKLSRIKDPEKLKNIQKEYDSLTPPVHEIFKKISGDSLIKLYDELLEINLNLWEIEDLCREFEDDNNFGESFIATARSVYLTNDLRSEVKKKINILTGSSLTEEKGYS